MAQLLFWSKAANRFPKPCYVDDKYLYWSDGGNILRLPKAGGTSEKIIPGVGQPDEIVMDGENFYWLIWTGEGSPPNP